MCLLLYWWCGRPRMWAAVGVPGAYIGSVHLLMPYGVAHRKHMNMCFGSLVLSSYRSAERLRGSASGRFSPRSHIMQCQQVLWSPFPPISL